MNLVSSNFWTMMITRAGNLVSTDLEERHLTHKKYLGCKSELWIRRKENWNEGLKRHVVVYFNG